MYSESDIRTAAAQINLREKNLEKLVKALKNLRAQRGATHEVMCTTCNGKKQIPVAGRFETCSNCHGEGTIRLSAKQ